MNGLRQAVTPMIETGALTIVSEEGTQVKGKQCIFTKSCWPF